MHDFSMLKFPLAKLFNHESKYPAAMRGRLPQLNHPKRRPQDAAEARKHAAVMREPTFTNPSSAVAKPRPAAAKASAPVRPSPTGAVLVIGAPTAPVQHTQAETAYGQFEAGTASRSGVPTPLTASTTAKPPICWKTARAATCSIHPKTTIPSCRSGAFTTSST